MKKKLLALSVLAAISSQANAFEIDTGDSDWSIRWDNTVKYNLAFRTNSPDKDVYAQPGASGFLAADPDLGFKSGDIISNRFDLLSELDVVWRDSFGFRISGAAWYDHAYSDDMDQPNSLAPHWGNPSVGVGELNDRGEELHYRHAELLDAFVFANFDIGDMAVGVRAGRHSIYWGQSLLTTGAVHSAGGSMNQIDANKGFTVPGTEVKELFMPTNKVSTVIQFTDNLTMEAYYGLEWEEYRLPEATSYMSPVDALTEDTEAIHLAVVGPIGLGLTSDDHESSDDEWGVNFSYYFEGAGMEVSAYYLNYSSKIVDGLVGAIDFGKAMGAGLFDGTALEPFKPIFGTDPFADPINPNNPGVGGYSLGSYQWVFKDDIDLFGISLSKEIAGISVGADFTYRKDTPLRPDFGASAQRFANYPDLPPALEEQLIAAIGPEIPLDAKGRINIDVDDYEDFFPTGDSYHIVLNALGLLTDNGIWEGGSYIVEFTMGYLDEIHQLENLVLKKGDTSGVKLETGDVFTHLAVNFNPTWYQVFPGTDMTLRASVGVGINNSASTGFGGDEEIGNGGIGLEFLVNQRWTVSGRYNFFFGPWKNGTAGRWKDRENVAFTVKRTF
jgi:hypothetical protein